MNKNIRWLLFIHTDLEKQQLFKVLDFQSIKEIGYILDMKPQIISNYYHNLIKERGVLKYCIIYQVSK
jgi:citrate lyase synthetase|tara:strand:+ start:1808 stop:2011 length:204 start_codon:yes stop_codon:yes gene_type:complete